MARTLSRRRNDDLVALPSLFDRLVGETMWPRPIWGEEATPRIPVDMVEENGAIVVHASVPGLAREDLHVEVLGDELRIWGERKETREHEAHDVYLREHHYGRVERRVTLPHDVDADAAEASFRHGVLTLTLPIVAGEDRHEIEVQDRD